MSPFIWMVSALIRWVRLKIYQYEVTFAVYMLTPTEKFIFNSLLLSVISMIVTAAYVYLPDHIRAIYSHIYYYWAGDRPFISSSLSSINSIIHDGGTQNLGAMYETAKNAAAAATATMQVREL